MKNYNQDGSIVVVAAPSGGVVSGQAFRVGLLFGVAQETAAQGVPVAMVTQGEVTLPKAAGEITAGAVVYWSTANSNVTTTATANLRIGVATLLAASGASLVRVRLHGAWGAVSQEAG